MVMKNKRTEQSICIVAENYPNKKESPFPFVQELARGLTSEGVKCTVIAPQSITRAIVRRKKLLPIYDLDFDENKNQISVIRPYYISFSNTKKSGYFSDLFFSSAIKYAIKKLRHIQNVYCYFWHVGLLTARCISDEKVKITVQASEASLSSEAIGRNLKYLKRISRVVCASSKNFEESENAGLLLGKDVKIIVNGYQPKEFFHIDKFTARERLGFDSKAFILVFVGSFIKRKGIVELDNVLNRFEDVYSIFIGSGEYKPHNERILFADALKHDQIVEYINCGDIFVLPTKAEGCCNAIIEAIACGLPVISSKKSFNNEILDDSYSIRIDESNEEELYEAIYYLKESKEARLEMSNNALKKAAELTLQHRITRVMDFLFD